MLLTFCLDNNMLPAKLLPVLNGDVFKCQHMYNISRRTIVDCQLRHLHSGSLKYANLTCSTNKHSIVLHLRHINKVEVVDEYKYLGTTIDNKLKWDRHCNVTYKKCQQRLYWLRKLRSFNIDNTILSMFYKSCIQSVLTFSFICWFGKVSQKDKNKLQRVVNIISKIIGLKQTSVTALYEKQILRKANTIINDSTHILYNEYVLLPSSRKFRTIISKTNRKRDSFMPMSVRLLNSKR